MPLNFEDMTEHVRYSGKLDWGIGFSPLSPSKERPYTSYLVIVESKVAGGIGLVIPQLLGYLGCTWRYRCQNRLVQDFRVYGLGTDGHQWQFWMIETNGRVRGSRVYDIDGDPAELRLVFTMVMYMLVKAAAWLANTPEKPILGQVVGNAQVDDSAVVVPQQLAVETYSATFDQQVVLPMDSPPAEDDAQDLWSDLGDDSGILVGDNNRP